MGRLAGTVLDASGGVLPGATVTITNDATEPVADDGHQRARAPSCSRSCQAGTYKVVDRAAGVQDGDLPDVVINVNQESSLTAQLEIGALTETVEVEASSRWCRRRRRKSARTVEQKQVLQLPLVNRDMTNLIRMQAGVPGVATRMNTGDQRRPRRRGRR